MPTPGSRARRSPNTKRPSAFARSSPICAPGSGTLLREVNDLPRAREQYEAAVAARPMYAPARIQLGVTLLSLGESDAAAEQWRKVLEIDPDNVRARMYLRIMASARGESAPPKPTA